MTATKVLFRAGWLPVADHISARIRDAEVVRRSRERVPQEMRLWHSLKVAAML